MNCPDPGGGERSGGTKRVPCEVMKNVFQRMPDGEAFAQRARGEKAFVLFRKTRAFSYEKNKRPEAFFSKWALPKGMRKFVCNDHLAFKDLTHHKHCAARWLTSPDKRPISILPHIDF